jgi:hypothetical protein
MQKPILIVTSFEYAEWPSYGDLTNNIEYVELYLGKQIKRHPVLSMVGQRGYESAIYFVHKWLIGHQRARSVHIGDLPTFRSMLLIACLGKDILMV